MTLAYPKPAKGSPLKKSKRPSGKDPAHLDRVRRLPCCICGRHPVDAHHVFCGRFSQRKVPDRMTIPLCDAHHQGLWDTSGIAIHKQKETWVKMYGPDHEYIAPTLDAIEEMGGAKI